MMNNVLIVDSDQMMLGNLTNLLQVQSGFLQVHTAMSHNQALDIVGKRPVKIVITPLKTPELDGFKLIEQLSSQHPGTKVIAINRDDVPMHSRRMAEFPSAIYLDQSHDLNMLTKRVLTELQIDYGGQVRGVTLTSFVQMMALETVSCELKVSSKDQFGFLWLDRGELIAARLPGDSGKSAAMKILAWKNVLIDINYSPRNIQPEISDPLMMILLESSQKEDEFHSKNGNKRKHERYELLVAIDCDMQDTKRHCALWDICLGGAYLETDHDIKIGETMRLSLNSPPLRSTCTLDAKVVRKDRNGIGVEFLPINPQQQQMVKTLIDGSITPLNWNDHPNNEQQRERRPT